MMTDNDPVLNELDACVETIKSMSGEVAELRQLLAKTMATLEAAVGTIAALNKVMPLLSKAQPLKRGRGRQRKVIDDSWMLEWFAQAKAEFVISNKFIKPTDSAVITWSFEQMFLRHGWRASKAHLPEFQSKLKRFKNRLGDVRNPLVKTPIK